MSLHWTLSAALAALVVGCGATKSSPTPLRLSFAVPPPLEAGKTSQLIVYEVMSDGTRLPVTDKVTWTSSDPSIASVSSTGLLTAGRAGSVTISASYQSLVCSAPASVVVTPTPPPIPTPPTGPITRTVESFHMEGVVLNDDGQPLVNAQVGMNTCINVSGDYCLGQYLNTHAQTDGAGRYAMDFQAVRGVYRPDWLSNAIGVASAGAGDDEFFMDLQFVTATTSQVVRNFRLTRIINLDPGGQATASFAPDASLCVIDDFSRTVCRYVRLNIPGAGTVTVTAIPLNGSLATPWIALIDESEAGVTGTLTYAAKPGPALLEVSIPAGSSAVRDYRVSFTFQPKSQ